MWQRKKKNFFFFIWVTEKMKDGVSELQDTQLLCARHRRTRQQVCFFFLLPITSELSKRAFADTNRSQTDLVRTSGEQEAHSEASELLNGLSLFFFSPCLSDMQIHAARCSKNPKL